MKKSESGMVTIPEKSNKEKKVNPQLAEKQAIIAQIKALGMKFKGKDLQECIERNKKHPEHQPGFIICYEENMVVVH